MVVSLVHVAPAFKLVMAERVHVPPVYTFIEEGNVITISLAIGRSDPGLKLKLRTELLYTSVGFALMELIVRVEGVKELAGRNTLAEGSNIATWFPFVSYTSILIFPVYLIVVGLSTSDI